MRFFRFKIDWRLWPAIFATLVASSFAAHASQTITDYGIVNAVEDEMLFDHAVPFNHIDVQSNDGIVTLTGRVDNLMAKERATLLAESVKGVRGIVNRIQVDPRNAPAPAKLESRVDRALLADPATDSWEIDIDANAKGVVTLTGTVQSWHERRLAENVAKSVDGVTDVNNLVTITYELDRADHEILPEIEQNLRWNNLVDHGLIDVSVDDGKVVLEGTVGSAAEKRLAKAYAWVSGVSDVDASGLKVALWARDPMLRENKYAMKSDDEIRDAVNDALLYDPRVMSFNVTPRVHDGRVSLHGIVDNAKAKQSATETAGQVVGVNEVRNYLKVRPELDMTDAQIETSLEQAFARDAWIDAADVDVSVKDGTAYLAGTVDWSFEKSHAFDAAIRTKGVTDVINGLEVRSETIAPMPAWNPVLPGLTMSPAISRTTDDAIARSIENQLWWSPFVDSDDVDVEVKHGVAMLTGTVESWREYRAAAENALEGGAIDIRNELVVTTNR